jgi:hypothetical protein
MNVRRSVGRRKQRPGGVLRAPTPQEVQWSATMGRYRTRVPKGVFRYRSMAEANADWERWHVDLVAAAADRDADD